MRLIKRLGASVLVVALLAWVVYRAWHDAQEIQWHTLNIRWGLLIASGLLYGFGFVWQGIVWTLMMRMLGYRLAMLPGVRACAASQLGNYIPGKVFIVLFRVQVAAKYGVPGVPVAGSIALETLLRNMMAAVLAALGLYQVGAGMNYMWGLAILVLISAVFAQPRVFHAIGDWVLRKLKRPQLPDRLTGPQVAMLLFYYFAYWVIQCGAFFLMARSTLGAELGALPLLSSALLASQLGSTLAVFAPVGLGAAEFTMAGVLALTGGIVSPYVLALMMRVWRTVFELLQIGIVWLIPLPPPADEADAPADADIAEAAAVVESASD